MTEPYPRDLVGYGGHPPHPNWPNGARLALSMVLNYEEGGEASVLHGDPASEAYLHEIPGQPALYAIDSKTLGDLPGTPEELLL